MGFLLRLLTAAFGTSRNSRHVRVESEKRTTTDIGYVRVSTSKLAPARSTRATIAAAPDIAGWTFSRGACDCQFWPLHLV